MKPSKSGSLNKEDLKSIAWTLAMVAGSAILTKSLEILPGMDFGSNSALIIVVLTTLLKAAQKFVAGR